MCAHACLCVDGRYLKREENTEILLPRQPLILTMHKTVCQVNTTVLPGHTDDQFVLTVYNSKLQSLESSEFGLEKEIMEAAIL